MPGSPGALPFHLRGNYAPVLEEVTAVDLPVEGAVPRELRGLYVRNGPNPKSGSSPHWFFGDGMLHGVQLGEGRAAWYRNRWVRTRDLEEGPGEMLGGERTGGRANTHVVAHAGRILALEEASYPTEVTRDLSTRGCFDFGGRLTTAMTAHPKVCPRTGALHFFGYDYTPPFLTYHRADADGLLVQSEVIDVPGPTMIHDFAITDRYVVFMDLPVVFDLALAQAGAMPYRWSDDYGARVGLMPHGGTNADVRWFEVAPCYVFHPLNAFDDADGSVVVDVARYRELWRPGAGSTQAALHRWRIDPARGGVAEQELDERAVEFPRCDERRTGRAHRYGYAVRTEDRAPESASSTLIKYDLRSGATAIHDCGPGRIPGEGVFVPASPGAGEDHGWVLTYVYDSARDGSDLVIVDAADFAGKPVATVRLPQRVPFGFHGSFIPDPA
jgi:carotenoid cleavage dioxygenase